MSKIKVLGTKVEASHLCIVCNHVLQGAEIVEVGHDLDGVIQLMCERYDHGPVDASPVGADHLVDKIRQLKIGKLPPGYCATRGDEGWVVAPIPE